MARSALRTSVDSSIPRRARALFACAALLAGGAATGQATTRLRVPAEVLEAFRLRDATLQDLTVPGNERQPFELQVALGGIPRTLRLQPHRMFTPGFQAFADDGKTLRRIAVPMETTYQGEVAGIPGSAVALSIEDGTVSAHILLAEQAWTIQPLADQFADAPRSRHIVYERRSVIPSDARCAQAGLPEIDHRSTPLGNALVECEIALDCQFDFFMRHRGSTTATIAAAASRMNKVDIIYRRDVTICYRIPYIVVRTARVYQDGPSVGCISTANLLDEMRSRWNTHHTGVPRDIAHMLSAWGTFSGIVGCAWVGVICDSKTSGKGYGVSRVVSANDAENTALVAHEIGHNWNASHCSGSSCNIMCAGLGGCSGNYTTFGATSQSSILSHKASRSCLSAGSNDPTPCLAQNWDFTNAGVTGSPANLAMLASTGASSREIASVDLFMRARSAAHTVKVSIWSRSTRTRNLPPDNELGSGSVYVGTTLSMYTATLSSPVTLPANTDFFIVIDNASGGGVYLPVSSGGTMATHYWNGPPSWNGPFTTLPWQYRIRCSHSRCPPAAYTYAGTGCPSSAEVASRWMPTAFARSFGNTNNMIPFAWTPVTYQQVLDASNFPLSFAATGLGLRQDERFSGYKGATVDLEIRLSQTTRSAATMSSTFAANRTSPQTTVVKRQSVKLPDMGSAPTSPATVLTTIPFSRPFTVIGNQNLLLEVVQRGNSNRNNNFTYPLDASSTNASQSRLYGTSPTGLLGRGYGLVMSLTTPVAVPALSHQGTPRLGGTFGVAIANAPATTAAGLMYSLTAGDLDLTGLGMPGCRLYVGVAFLIDVAVTSSRGFGTFPPMEIPNDAALCGARFYQQAFVFDAGANGFGLITTQRGQPVIGS